MNRLCLPLSILLFLTSTAAAKTPPQEGDVVKTIQIQGTSDALKEKILKALPFRPGAAATPQKRELAEKIALSLLKNNGFLEAGASGTWQNSDGEGLFVIRIKEGPIYRFGKTHVQGLRSLPHRIIDIERAYEEGEPYSSSALLETQTRLYMTGLVENIRIKTSTHTARTADVSIQLDQKNLKWIKGGVGWGSEEKQRVTLILNHKNVWRRAHEVELMGMLSSIWQEYKLTYVDPYFFNTRTESRTSVSWRAEDWEGYQLERISGVTGLGRELKQDVRGNLSYQIKRTLTFDVDPEILSIAPESSDSRSVALTLNRNKTNDPFFPTRGTNTELRLERTGGFLGGTIDFNRAAFNLRGYRTIAGPFTGAMALRSGVVREFSPSVDVPIFERFFTGGANSVRGYKERGVGPLDSAGSPLGGEWLLGTSVETRFPLFWRLTGALFVDGGMVGPEARDVAISDWKYGGGGGIRFKTPVGPIRLDYGYKLNRDENDNDPWRLHFSLGESF